MMKISDAGIALIMEFESFEPKPYNDPAKNCTVGFGELIHLGPCDGRESEALYKNGISREAALTLLRKRVDEVYAKAVNDLVKVALTQSQFDALVSLCYNCGPGKIAELCRDHELNRGNYRRAGEAIKTICIYGTDGVKYPGLVRRRAREAAMFLDGIPEEKLTDDCEWRAVAFAAGVNVRRSPMMDAGNIIASAPNGAKLAVSKTATNGYRQVVAWVHESMLRPDFNVPYLSQTSATAPDPNDCGQACAAMLAASVGKIYTVKQVVDGYAALYRWWQRGTFTSLQQMYSWLESIGIKSRITNTLGGVGVALVHYSLLPAVHVYDTNFARADIGRDGHFVVHLGNGFVNDPLWPDAQGAGRNWGVDAMNRAFAGWFLELA